MENVCDVAPDALAYLVSASETLKFSTGLGAAIWPTIIAIVICKRFIRAV